MQAGRSICTFALFFAACGCGAPAAPQFAAATSDALPNVEARIRHVVLQPQVTAYDTFLANRVKLLAFSDDPAVCSRLNRGAGKRRSSTVFVMMGGDVGAHYRLQRELAAVLDAGVSVLPAPGIGIVTAQLLDDACQLVTAPGAKAVEAVATAGEVAFSHRPGEPVWQGQVRLGLQGSGAPLDAAFTATRCDGLMAAIAARMSTGDAKAGRAAALACDD